MRYLSSVVLLTSILLGSAACNKPNNCVCQGSRQPNGTPKRIGSYSISKGSSGVNNSSPYACQPYVDALTNQGYYMVSCTLN